MSSSAFGAGGLPTGTVVLTLVAAALHATWNAMAHGVSDRLVGFALIGVSYTVISGLAVLLLGSPPAGAWPFVLASAALHVVYTLLLWTSYELGDFSQTYPVARGVAPWAVAVIEVALGRHLPVLQLTGIVVISAGLLALALGGGRATWPALTVAGATGLAIAGYTVIDAAAVSAVPVPVYAAWMFLLQGPVLPAIALLRRGRALRGLRRSSLAVGLGGGLVSLLAYGLVLVAQTSGATAAVAALRETSVVFAAAIGAVFFKESLGVTRVGAAGIVAAGIVLVSL